MAVFTGARIRDNSVFGTTTNNPLAAGDTTLNSAGLANLSAVASNHAVIVLDPLRAAGAPEIVIVTAHTGAATSATITRGAYGTSARSHASGTLWVVAATVDDLIRICTAATRPADQYEGQLIYETDTDSFKAHNGTAWEHVATIGAWTTYTPTNTNVTVGNGVQAARYMRGPGRTIRVAYQLVWGSSTSFAGGITIGLPFATANLGVAYIGSAVILDAGVTFFSASCMAPPNTSGCQVYSADASGVKNVSATIPMTWVTTDELHLSLTYEAAS